MFGHATYGQLGLGEDCTDRAFRAEKVQLDAGMNCQMVALGDTHSLLLSNKGNIYTTGANDKCQLGLNPDQRQLKIFKFTQISHFKTGDVIQD